MTELTVFAFDTQAVRTLMVEADPWFVASDLLAILSLDRKALERLDDDEKGVSSIHTPGGTQDMTIVNEPGMYSLVLGSRKKAAKPFKRWVTHEVLPSLRKTGRYEMPGATPHRDQPLNLNHRADIIVSADRTFRATMRTSRAARLSIPQALRRAQSVTLEQTGVDIFSMLDMQPPEDPPPLARAAPPADSRVSFWRAWCEQQDGLPVLRPLPSNTVYDLYLLWCEQQGIRQVDSMSRLVTYLTGQPGVIKRRIRVDAAHNPLSIIFLEGTPPPSDQTLSRWLGDCLRQHRSDLAAWISTTRQCGG